MSLSLRLFISLYIPCSPFSHFGYKGFGNNLSIAFEPFDKYETCSCPLLSKTYIFTFILDVSLHVGT